MAGRICDLQLRDTVRHLKALEVLFRLVQAARKQAPTRPPEALVDGLTRVRFAYRSLVTMASWGRGSHNGKTRKHYHDAGAC